MDQKRIRDDKNEIDLLALVQEILRYWYLVILAGAVGALIAATVTQLFITPKYVSTTRLYVLAKAGTTDSITSAELQASSLLSNDYVELVKSREVMENAITKMNLTDSEGKLLSAAALSKKLSVSVQNNSRVVKIDITDSDPYKACDIANAVRIEASEQIRRVMDSEAVNVVDEANVPTQKSSPSITKNFMIGGLIGVVLVIGVITILYLTNDRVTTEEDVRKYLGLSTLGVIPLAENEKKSRRIFRRAKR